MATTDNPQRKRRGISLELKTVAMIAGVLGAVYAVLWRVLDIGAVPQLAIGLGAGFAVIAVVLDILVYRPLGSLIKRSQRRLGDKYDALDPAYRDEISELGYMLETLISVFTSAEDKETAAQSIREDLVRLQTFSRQLVEVGEIGQEINAALPYKETVDRSLTRAKRFLHADFAALLMLDPESRALRIEGTFGVRSRTLDADCCMYTADCPVRRAINGKTLVRSSGHTCTLFPATMKRQVIVPVTVEGIGEMALLATATAATDFDKITDGVFQTLEGHLENALSNAHKYDGFRRQAITDHLTHLYNRRHFMDRAAEELDHSLKNQTPMSIVMIDIDHFKEINDTYGHSNGDRVLQALSAIMQDAVRTDDICARHGGEEFVMLLPSTPGENAASMADRLRHTVGQWRYTGLGLPGTLSITVSAGVATCPHDATTVDELLELSDKALYRAKADGRDRVCQYGVEESVARRV
jgi:diguanylate cyclase (GGDEF)-like protein